VRVRALERPQQRLRFGGSRNTKPETQKNIL
jgi:hypothetical protein